MLWFSVVGSAIKSPCTGESSALQGMATSIGSSNLFRAFWVVSFELFIIWIDITDASQLSRIVELRFLESPSLLFDSLSSFSTLRTNLLATDDQVLWLLEFFCEPLSGPHISVRRFFTSKIVNCVKTGPWFRHVSIAINVPMIIHCGILATHSKKRMCSPGHVNVSQWY